MRIDPAFVERQIQLLVVEFPEISEDETLRADMIEGETGAHEFLAKLIDLIGETEAMNTALDERAKQLSTRSARFGRRIQAYRAMVRRVMEAAELRKLELPEATISIKLGPRAVIVTDETMLEAKYTRTKVEPDKKAIKAALEAGSTVMGAELSNAADVLQIRTS